MVMEADKTTHGDLRQWLLGLLPQPEGQALEERLIGDAELYDELFIIEEELVDEYLAGALTSDERKAFESYFMNSPERQEQFRIANALRVYIDDSKQPESSRRSAMAAPDESKPALPKPPPRSPWLFRQPIAAVSLVVSVLLVVAVVWFALSLRSASSGNSLSVFLTPAVQTREGGAVQTVIVPPGTELLQLHLRLARNDFPKYRATLVNSEGNVVQTSEDLSPVSEATGPTIPLSVKAEQMPPGEYQLKLDGLAGRKFESVDSYRFVVVKQ